jgi:selenide, water dikinase
MAVTGVIHPEKVVTNRSAQPGDYLILTKPIGTGILSTAMKQGLLEPEHVESFLKSMSTLNETAAEAMQEVGVNACTDVTDCWVIC